MPTGWTLAVWLALEPGAGQRAPPKRPLVAALSVSEGPCIDKERLAEATGSWLGYKEIDARLEISVRLQGNDAIAFDLANEGTVKVEREMPAPKNCADRHAALGLSIAMAIDASVYELAAAAPRPPNDTQSEPPPEDDDAPKLTARERPKPAPARKTRVDVYAGAFAGFELLPDVAFGGRAGVSVGPLPWLDVDIEALAAGGLPFTIGIGEVQPTLAGGAVAVCPAKRWRRFSIRLCVAAAAGAVVAEGRDFDESRSTTLPWVAGRALFDARFRVAKIVWLGVTGGFVAPIVRTNFDIVNEGQLVIERRQVAGAGGIAGFDLVVTIPSTLD